MRVVMVGLALAMSGNAMAKGGTLRPPRSLAMDKNNKKTRDVSVQGPAPVRRFRFDALRVDGLAGPNALMIRGPRLKPRRRLLGTRRPFVRRLVELLHGLR